MFARFHGAGSYRYRFLAWNLFLAWVPYVASCIATLLNRKPARPAYATAALAAVWVLFLPNAPYLVTDFVHLLSSDGFPIWYDVGLLAAFAWAGLLLTVISLRQMHALVDARFGVAVGRAFVVAASLVTGAGVYVGRVLRWNSWDVVTQPGVLLAQFADRAGHPLDHRKAAVISLLFAAFVWVCYATFTAAARGAVDAESAPQ